ncbi:MAG: GGDEF domain-containing protein [Lachnospiraceae bacterium]|uniref:GGDEF domain-containing protein n=1 Tax=Candidatus Weimeria bifida TaxID=2599074 RepID=A0A6N7IZL7_9FIRM|nr:GGDEF domain-containing protein [Candidatus Weimeria bifida]RRF96545.1 MAG: GGDEF domain-containing protein [Lachnospiraceae bacterium]
MLEDSREKVSPVRGVMAFAVSLMMVMLFVFGLGKISASRPILFKDGWSVDYNDKTYRNVNLNRFRFPKRIEAGDTIELNNTIPTTFGKNLILVFETDYAHVEVYINGRYTYSYLKEPDGSKGVPGRATHMVSLPEDAAGKQCRIIISPGLDDAFVSLPQFHVIPASQISSSYISIDLISSLAGFFLFMNGIIMLFVAFILFVLKRRWEKPLAASLLSFSIGVWTFCRVGVIELFSTAYQANTRLEHLILYFSTLPFIELCIFIRGVNPDKKRNFCAHLSFVIMAVFFATAFVVEYTSIVNPIHFYFLFQMVMLADTCLLIYGTKNQERTRGNLLERCSIYIVLTGAVCDVIRFNIKKSMILDNRILFHSIMPYIAVVFIILIMFIYLNQVNTYFSEQAQEEALKKLAYTDVLTGLHNRAWIDARFKKLKESESEYQVISLDVNGLKTVNDSMGHAAGDSLLQDCADILTTCFEDIGSVVRMGGDEFLILINAGKGRFVRKALHKMKKMEAGISTKRKYDINFSYGVSSSDELSNMTPDMVYELADNRMYQMKKRRKASR